MAGMSTVKTPDPRLEKLWSVRLPILVIRPEKVVLVLSPPTLSVRWVESFHSIVPAPASEPMASPPPASCQVAPELTITGTVSAMRLSPEMSLPALTMSGPVKVLAPERVRLPAPVLDRPPAPLKTLAMVRLLAVAGMSTEATPPIRRMEWLFAVVPAARVAAEVFVPT